VHDVERTFPEEKIMPSSKLIGWTSFVLFGLSILILIALLLSPAIGDFEGANPDAFLWIIGVLSLISSVLGFVSFRTPQGKVGAIGGLVLLALVLFLTPISVAT
jgi:hypothetical protein